MEAWLGQCESTIQCVIAYVGRSGRAQTAWLLACVIWLGSVGPTGIHMVTYRISDLFD